MLKRSFNTPAHLYADNALYFITGAIYRKRALLKDENIKQKLLKLTKKYFENSGWELYHWVILDNHYHLTGKSRKGQDLPTTMRNIHRASAIKIRQKTGCEKPVWWNYWDYCPRDEKDYMTRVNYLLYNPIRHGYVVSLHDYGFSSFHELYNKKGREKLIKQFKQYPDYKDLILNETNKDDY